MIYVGKLKKLLVFTAVSAAYGGSHLAAWNYDFPSVVEKWMWRASGLAFAGVPFVYITNDLLRIYNSVAPLFYFGRIEKRYGQSRVRCYIDGLSQESCRLIYQQYSALGTRHFKSFSSKHEHVGYYCSVNRVVARLQHLFAGSHLFARGILREPSKATI